MNSELWGPKNLILFFNELKKKLMNSEWSDFFATFLTFNE